MNPEDIFQEERIRRVIIEKVSPEINGGRFPAKRVVGERFTVAADIFCDGHASISGALLHRKRKTDPWMEDPLRLIANDRWAASFRIEETGRYFYTVCAWIDDFKTWRGDLAKKAAAEQDTATDFLIGADIIERTAGLADQPDAGWLMQRAEDLRGSASRQKKIRLAFEKGLLYLVQKYPDRASATFYEKVLPVVVEREKALFSTWYEMFPRSCGENANAHGTFADCEKMLPYIASMGFDVLYLPPVHPIGRTQRKGKNNSPIAQPGDPGSPWAIGSDAGGHRELHPRLGTLEDFRGLICKAADHGIEIAMDIAFQCAPDHPYVRSHPDWFRRRPDGSIQYAENPPKKYEDIYPLDFESAQWRELIEELRDVVFFWIDQGVRIFRVDNPHTKPFAFWEWLISCVKEPHPEVVFLAEAFTRPKIMYRLAKLGFSQSYTYFSWRNTAHEIQKYFRELTRTRVREYFRPSLWPNTPDILPEYLQSGGRSGFIIRLVLAATLGSNYGIYGPAFELCADQPREPGSEEYRHSEKYEIKSWDIHAENSLRDLIARINGIRKENSALQNMRSLTFHGTDNPQILCYSKHAEDRSNIVLVVVNLDAHHRHTAWVDLPLAWLRLDAGETFQMHDLLSDARFLWNNGRNFVDLDPAVMPAHVFAIRRKVRTERNFDYYL